jgi:hypothetical protein
MTGISHNMLFMIELRKSSCTYRVGKDVPRSDSAGRQLGSELITWRGS